MAALVLGAHAVAEWRSATADGEAVTGDGATEGMARLRWAQQAGCAEIQRLARDSSD